MMARYIDAEKIVPDAIKERKFVIREFDPLHVCDIIIRTGYADLTDFIAAQPTAEVAPVVMCENCKYWDEERKEKHTYSSEDSTLVDFCECKRWSNFFTCHMTRYNDYCSQAERKEDNG